MAWPPSHNDKQISLPQPFVSRNNPEALRLSRKPSSSVMKRIKSDFKLNLKVQDSLQAETWSNLFPSINLPGKQIKSVTSVTAGFAAKCSAENEVPRWKCAVFSIQGQSYGSKRFPLVFTRQITRISFKIFLI